MNRWMQTKRYVCPACGAVYLHDRAYQHAAFACPARVRPGGATEGVPMSPASLTVSIDHSTHEVRLIGSAGTEITLTWAQTANLASLLNQASKQAEPPARAGKTYRPTCER